MSMEGLVRMHVERAERVDIDGLGAVFDSSRLPAMVKIVNLSRTGCLFATAQRPEIGTRLTIGIPGIGSRSAIVMRSGADGVGCAFDATLRPSEVDKARAARTTDEGEASAAIRALRRTFSEKGEARPPTWYSRLVGSREARDG